MAGTTCEAMAHFDGFDGVAAPPVGAPAIDPDLSWTMSSTGSSLHGCERAAEDTRETTSVARRNRAMPCYASKTDLSCVRR